MLLNEINHQCLYEQDKKRDKIVEWFRQMRIFDYVINEDFTVDVNGDVNISNKHLISIPVQFRKVSGSVHCNDNQLSSLRGCPIEVGHIFSCTGNRLLSSLQFAPRIIGHSLHCANCNIESLHDIHKMVKSIGVGFYAGLVTPMIKSNILGLLLIEKLQGMTMSQLDVADIINKYLKGDKNTFQCYEELINLGPEYEPFGRF